MIDAFRVAFPYLGTLWKNDAQDAYFDGHRSGSSHAWKVAGKSGEPPGWEADDEAAERNADPTIEGSLDEISERAGEAFGFIVDALERLEREFTQEALTQWAAFRGFCEEELGLQAAEVLGTIMPPAVEYVRSLEERAERPEIEPDPKGLQEYRAITDGA